MRTPWRPGGDAQVWLRPESRVEVIAGYEPPFSRGASGCDGTLTLSVVDGSERRWETERGRALADSNIKSPDLSFVVPAANENRWSDLLATLISTEPDQIARLLQIECDSVRREVVVPGLAGRRSDRLDLLLQSAGRSTAAIEVKLLSDLARGSWSDIGPPFLPSRPTACSTSTRCL
jgi:hypothetical protein